MHRQDLSGDWELRQESLAVSGERGARQVAGREADWLAATVPGEVHLELVKAGVMPEPLHSLNAPHCRWPEDRSWWYRKRFTADAQLLAADRVELSCEGVDYYGQVFLNGTCLGETENAFVPAVFTLKGHLRVGENELLIRVTVGTERAEDQTVGEATPQKPYGHRTSFKGIRELRKPQFTYGWDWVEALPNIGLWRGVSLWGYRRGRLAEVRPAVSFTPEGAARVRVETGVENLHPWAESEAEVTVRLTGPGGDSYETRQAFVAQVGVQTPELELTVSRPERWWPNGLGGQPLYRLCVELQLAGETVDVWEKSIGLRTVGIDRTPLPEGRRFAIQVNGEDVFCKGGNWIPADAILARVTPEKLEALVRAAAEANCTMLRVWGGGIYEADAFYEACDRYGILVWQDFMFACSPYPDQTAAFQDKIRREAAAAVRRLRHHPCLALWSGNNENVWGFADWWNSGKQFPAPDLELGGTVVYGQILPEVCRTLDPERPYWPGSPCGGDKPNSETSGDCHWWGPGTMHADLTRRYRHEIYDECRARFVSEYGVIGPCHLASFREALKPEELTVDSPAWKAHTNTFEKETTPAAIRHHYADPENLPLADYVRYGQMFQAQMYGRTIEALRFRQHDAIDDCQGALIWMWNDCWCETGWTPIDYALRRKASFYWIKNACYPVRALVRRRGERLVTRLVNDRREAVELTVRQGWLPVDTRRAEPRLESRTLRLAAGGMIEIGAAAIPPEQELPPEEWFYAAWGEGENLEHIPSVWLLRPFRRLRPARDEIEVKRTGRQLTLTSPVYCHGVAYADEGAALLSDNYFDLLPNLPKTVEWRGERMPAELSFRALT